MSAASYPCLVYTRAPLLMRNMSREMQCHGKKLILVLQSWIFGSRKLQLLSHALVRLDEGNAIQEKLQSYPQANPDSEQRLQCHIMPIISHFSTEATECPVPATQQCTVPGELSGPHPLPGCDPGPGQTHS